MSQFKDEFNKTQPTSPYSIRFTPEERIELDARADGMPLSEYIKQCLFEHSIAVKKPKRKYSIKDHKALAKVIGFLARDRYASNLNQLAKAANSGSLPVNDETEKNINDAYRAIMWMRGQVMLALGVGGRS